MISTPTKMRRSTVSGGILGSAQPKSPSFFTSRDFMHVRRNTPLPLNHNRSWLLSQFRTIAILITICLLALTLLSTLDSVDIQTESLQMLDNLKIDLGQLTSSDGAARPPRIKKLSAVIGDKNDIYEAALRTHERHNAMHGYDMEILRERIVGAYWEKPAYLLAKVIEELSKPVARRNDWIMWCDPDTIVLNPQIPLEIFLPPADLNETIFVGSHDEMGFFNAGVFFLRVDEWTVNLLIETLAYARVYPDLDLGIEKARTAMQAMLGEKTFRKRAVFQPRTWFNAFEFRSKGFEGPKGSMMVHFHGLEGDKWPLMTRYLRKVRSRQNPFETDIAETSYVTDAEAYWNRIRRAQKLLKEARPRKEDEVRAASDRAYHAISFEADNEAVFVKALERLAAELQI